MFDTHCHLNFKAFKKTLPDVIKHAQDTGVTYIVIPGTDVKTSKKAIEIAENHEHIYAAVGIHPHHVFKLINNTELTVASELKQIEELLLHPKVLAVGEIGMDRHEYKETVYGDYHVDDMFITLQKELLEKQIQLAVNFKKSLILHNREAKQDLLPIVLNKWNSALEKRSVFHCCEPDLELLNFAKGHNMFIGIDGDITYTPEKQEFIKEVPLEMLVLETDSPFLLPEPLKTKREFPNNPSNLSFVAKEVARVKGINLEEVIKVTTQNAKILFNI